jgi:hypothetical protein
MGRFAHWHGATSVLRKAQQKGRKRGGTMGLETYERPVTRRHVG